MGPGGHRRRASGNPARTKARLAVRRPCSRVPATAARGPHAKEGDRCSLAGAALMAGNPARADGLRERIAADLPGLMALYRDLHAHPELSFAEVRSAKILADAARKARLRGDREGRRTGVVAVLKNGPGPTVLIRADMDALPVIEQTGLPYACKVARPRRAGSRPA